MASRMTSQALVRHASVIPSLRKRAGHVPSDVSGAWLAAGRRTVICLPYSTLPLPVLTVSARAISAESDVANRLYTVSLFCGDKMAAQDGRPSANTCHDGRRPSIKINPARRWRPPPAGNQSSVEQTSGRLAGWRTVNYRGKQILEQ